MAEISNETVQVDDGAVVHTSESEAPSHAEVHHVLSEEAQALVDKIQSMLTVNFDRKLAGAVLTADMYNKMNDMFVRAHNQHDRSVEALKQYILQFLPNFVDVHVPTDDGGETILEGTIENGVLDIDLHNVIVHITASTRDDLTELIIAQLEAALEEMRHAVESTENLMALTKEDIDALLDGDTIPEGEESLISTKTRTLMHLVAYNTKGTARTVTLTETEE